MDMNRFSERLIALRKERGMTQNQLAEELKKFRSTISGYETEGKEPDFETLCVLAEYFGVTTDFLLGRDDERTHADVVFRNDNANLKKNYDALSPELKLVVTDIFDNFYVLLNRDMKNGKTARLTLYRDLIHRLQSSRADIKKHIESSESITDNQFLSELMELQNTMKADIASIIDKLMQTDLDYNINAKKG